MSILVVVAVTPPFDYSFFVRMLRFTRDTRTCILSLGLQTLEAPSWHTRGNVGE